MSYGLIEKIGSHEAPIMSADEIQASYEELGATRHIAAPIDYFEQTISTVAVEADLARGGEEFAEALADARNNPELRYVYSEGENSGKIKNAEGFINEMQNSSRRKDAIRAVIGELLLPRTGRVRLDTHEDFKDLPANSRIYRLNELEHIAESDLSDDMKAIVFSMMYVVHTSEAIKMRADNQREVIPHFATPEISFARLYAGGAHGQNRTKGFASYAGAYNSLSNGSRELLSNRFHDQSEEAASLIACLVFLKTSNRRNSINMEDIRAIKLDVMKHIEGGQLDLAREYIAELYTDEPELFTEISIDSVFGENVPEVNERPGNKAPEKLSKESMRGKPIDAKLAKTYCEEVLGLDESEIIARGEAMVGKLFGVSSPEDHTKDKRIYDFIHFERLSKMNTQTKRDILLGSIFDINSEDRNKMIRREPWRRMSFETAIVMEDLGRFVELDNSVSQDDVVANQSDYTVKLEALISDIR